MTSIIPQPEKICATCYLVKPVFEFSNGHLKCKACVRETARLRHTPKTTRRGPRLPSISCLPGEKQCTHCKDIKPVSEFSIKQENYRGSPYYHSWCKACMAENRRSHYSTDEAYERHVCANYGLKPGQYQDMFIAQFGLCAICGKAPENGKLQVDHCHKTNNIRELLCGHCNMLLGHANDDITVLKNAIKYLKKHST